MKLKRQLMYVLFVGLGSFWLSGKDIKTMITRGQLSWKWEMHQKLQPIFSVLSLGRLEPEGGVVLGIDLYLIYVHIFHDLILYLYIFYVFTFMYAFALVSDSQCEILWDTFGIPQYQCSYAECLLVMFIASKAYVFKEHESSLLYPHFMQNGITMATLGLRIYYGFILHYYASSL